jgi:hypothetical protein
MTSDTTKFRFDFSYTESSHGKTGTLEGLFADIPLSEKQRLNGTALTNGFLASVRKSIQEITGRIFTSEITQPLPLIDLKTIKCLYLANQVHGKYVFRLIAPPQKSKKPSLELRYDSYSLARNLNTGILADLFRKLSIEIDRSRLFNINSTLPSLNATLRILEEEHADISKTLWEWLQHDPSAITEAYKQLTEAINAYRPPAQPTDNPLNEALYTHLRTLIFQNFVYGYEEAIEKAKIKTVINPNEIELLQLCYHKADPLKPFINVASVDTFKSHIEDRSAVFAALIKRTTGIPTTDEDLTAIIEHARRVLLIFTHAHLESTDTKDILVSPLDCAAALCAIRHEAETAKTEHRPREHGSTEHKHNTPLPYLRAHRSIEDILSNDLIPHSVSQIMYNRWMFMSSKIMGHDHHERHEALMAFQIARLKKYAACLMSHDVDHIVRATHHFHDYCVSALKITLSYVGTSKRLS